MDSLNISVIIPVYNLERFLDPMLKSLKEQDIGDYTMEIIFVLNNCTDNSEEKIRQSCLNCKIMQCEIQGCGPARNVAMDVAQGEYIWFMDGDDWLLSNTAIKDVLDKAYSQNLDILRIPFDTNKFPWRYFSMVWQYLLRRDYINEFRFPHIQPAEDDAFMDMVLRKAGYTRSTYIGLPHMETPLYYYNYLREGSNMYRYIILKEKI